MPKINDYSTPQYGAQVNAIESSNGLRQDGAYGAGLQRLGGAVDDFGDMVYKRKAQEETSDLNASFSEARAEWAQNIDDETRNGTIDAAKTSEKINDYVNGMNQDFTTAEGRRMFERESARLHGFVLKGAARGQAQVAGAKAEANWRSALASNGAVLQTDPSDFVNTYQSTMDSIDDQVATGAIPATVASKFKLETGDDLAKSAIRGWANLNPDIAQKKLTAGEFDKYFKDADTKAAMQGYINSQKSAAEVEQRRVEKAIETAQKKRSEAWQSKHLQPLVDGQLPTKEIINAPDLKYDDKVAMLKLQDWASRERTQLDPGVENEIFRRINLPDGDPQQINNISQMVPMVGHGLTPESVHKLSGWIDDSPAGKIKKDGRKKLVDYATARLVKKDAFGMSDPKGELLLSQFLTDLQATEAEYAQDKTGKSVMELYNPSSNNYFGLTADKYKRSQKDIMKDTVQEMRKASIKKSVDFNSKTQSALPRQQGETIDAWLKRRRGQGS